MADKLRVSREAADDLQQIWDFIGQFSVAAADRIVEKIADGYLSLLQNPFKGRSRDDLLPGLRAIVVEKYIVFYRVEQDVVLIARIIHGARDLTSLLQEPG